MVTMGAVNMVAVVAAAMLLMAVPEAAAWNWTATPELVAESVERSINKSISSSSSSSRRHVLEGGGLPGCGSGNPIDNCWRCDPQWYRRRQRLADCAVGFGRNAVGGKHGRIYVVTDPSDEDAVNPRAGTLRHAVIQTEPLWIVFAHDMHIRLSQELLVQSYKTIDGRGARVHVAHGACITLQYVSHVIIHGIRVHDCVPTGNAMVRDSVRHYGWRTVADGDGISLFGATHVWIDRVSLWRCSDGLIDAIMASSAITVSNCHLSHHDKAMLLGHSDSYHPDKAMQVTIALNKFGPGLTQRMPRCRHGFFHVVNNEYLEWQMYAVGGSAGPTILSQGNRYAAPGDPFAKEVTKRVDTEEGEWKHWDWRSANDVLLNGAFFTQSGHRNSPALSLLFSSSAASSLPSSMVPLLTAQAGALDCRLGSPC